MRRMTSLVLLLTLAVGVGAANAQQSPAPPSYEYKVQTFGPTVSSEEIETALNRLGSEGWELVGVRTARMFYAPQSADHRREGDGVQVYVKRRKKNQ